jgi:hypothetical protein
VRRPEVSSRNQRSQIPAVDGLLLTRAFSERIFRSLPIDIIRSMKCPTCDTAISLRHSLGGGRYMCPACRNTACVARSYSLVLTGVAAVIAGLLADALGARGTVLIASVFIGVYPVSFLIGMINIQIFAPTLVPTGEFRSILYGGDDLEAAARAQNDDVNPVAPHVRARVRRAVLNGLALIAFVGLIAGAAGLFRLERSIYDVMPGLATKSGPRAFPVTVRIREDGLDFTNRSSGPWSCTTQIGIRELGSAPFVLEAAQTRTVAYASFLDGTVPLSSDAGYWIAREKIIVECGDRAGFSHFVVF